MELVSGELGSSHIKFNGMIQFKVLHCLETGLQLETHVVPNYIRIVTVKTGTTTGNS